jgi:hypothetical protein
MTDDDTSASPAKKYLIIRQLDLNIIDEALYGLYKQVVHCAQLGMDKRTTG